MSFPQKTLRWAEGIRDRLNSTADDESDLESLAAEVIGRGVTVDARKARQSEVPRKRRLAAGLYYGLRFRYGFSSALTTDNWTPWPDESDQLNCYGQAIANYAAADACGLNPILVEFVGFQKEGSTMRAGHSNVLVDVGEEGKRELWVIDQSLGMFGPVNLNGSSIAVENLDAKQGRTIRRDFRNERHGFIQAIVNDAEDISENVALLRQNPEAVLSPGQRIGIAPLDGWQSEIPLGAPQYLKFIPDRSGEHRGEIVSRIVLDRPGIRSRGLEYRFSLGIDGSIKNERLVGYYCSGMVWADFAEPVPVVDISVERVDDLLKGLTKVPVRERAVFETDLMNQSLSPPGKDKTRIEVARKSFERIRQSEYGTTVVAIAAAEALYQNEKGNGNYLTPREREAEVANFKRGHALLGFYAELLKRKKRATKETGGGRISDGPEEEIRRLVSLLGPKQIEDPAVLEFLAIRTEAQRLEYALKHRPIYLDDAVDRLVFYKRRIEGNESKLVGIAEARFGADYEAELFRGYTRIFAEFLGHFAMARPALCLNDYREKIVRKITSN